MRTAEELKWPIGRAIARAKGKDYEEAVAALSELLALAAPAAAADAGGVGAGWVNGAQLATAMRWLWPVLDPLMANRLDQWSDEDLLEAHATDWLREKALSFLAAIAKSTPARKAAPHA